MLAHTTSRHIIIGAQLAIGMLLLSASYFSGYETLDQTSLKASNQTEINKSSQDEQSEHC